MDNQKNSENKAKKNHFLIPILLIIILGFISYGNIINGEFIWDDLVLVQNNEFIRSWSYLPDIFSHNIGGLHYDYPFYRPLQIASYIFDYALWRLDVRGYHFINIALHVLTALSIFWFIRILYDDWLLSLFVSLLFVVNPIHTDVVSHISGRADIMAGFFMMFCFIMYIKLFSAERKTVIFLMMMLSYMLALLSKENSIVFGLLLLLYNYTFHRKFQIKRIIPIAVLGLLYVALRLTLLRTTLHHPVWISGIWQRIPGIFAALSAYIKLLIIPFPLKIFYGNKIFAFTDPPVLLGALLCFLLIWYARKVRNHNPLIFFSIGWFFVGLLPASNIYPLDCYMAERYLYLPAIGFFLILAKGLRDLYDFKEFKKLSLICIVSIVVFYSFLTIRQNTLLGEPIVFYKTILRYSPNEKKALNNLGLAYSRKGGKEEAVRMFKRIIAIDAADSLAYANLGQVYLEMDKKEEALSVFKKSIKISPADANIYYNIGFVYRALGKPEEAIVSIEKAIALDPRHLEAYNCLGAIMGGKKAYKEALNYFEQALKIDAAFVRTYNNIGITYMRMRDWQKAKEAWERALLIDPEFKIARDNLERLKKMQLRKKPHEDVIRQGRDKSTGDGR